MFEPVPFWNTLIERTEWKNKSNYPEFSDGSMRDEKQRHDIIMQIELLRIP
jgi:hypothetical protein